MRNGGKNSKCICVWLTTNRFLTWKKNIMFEKTTPNDNINKAIFFSYVLVFLSAFKNIGKQCSLFSLFASKWLHQSHWLLYMFAAFFTQQIVFFSSSSFCCGLNKKKLLLYSSRFVAICNRQTASICIHSLHTHWIQNQFHFLNSKNIQEFAMVTCALHLVVRVCMKKKDKDEKK